MSFDKQQGTYPYAYPLLATEISPAMRGLVRERWEQHGFDVIGK